MLTMDSICERLEQQTLWCPDENIDQLWKQFSQTRHLLQVHPTSSHIYVSSHLVSVSTRYDSYIRSGLFDNDTCSEVINLGNLIRSFLALPNTNASMFVKLGCTYYIDHKLLVHVGGISCSDIV